MVENEKQSWQERETKRDCAIVKAIEEEGLNKQCIQLGSLESFLYVCWRAET